jgi:hypothetical protein
MNSRESESLDRYITGNYGEDQFPVKYSFPDTAHAFFRIDAGDWLAYDSAEDGPEAHIINIEHLNEFMDRADEYLSKYPAYNCL